MVRVHSPQCRNSTEMTLRGGARRMPRAQTRFKQADIKRAVQGAKEAGVEIHGVEILRDGTIKLALGEKKDPAASAFDLWKGSRS